MIHRDIELVAEFGAELFARYGAGATGPEFLEAVRAQAAKRVALQFVAAADRELGSPQARRRVLALARAARARAASSLIDQPLACAGHARAEGPDPLRRQGHAAAPDHAHERQAARPGRQQAGAVLRHRGDGQGGDRRGRDHHRARDRRRDPGGGRRRLAVRREAHLHRPGRAARPRARGAHRRAVPRRLAVRDVPRRQPAPGRDRGPRRGVPQATSPTR